MKYRIVNPKDHSVSLEVDDNRLNDQIYAARANIIVDLTPEQAEKAKAKGLKVDPVK